MTNRLVKYDDVLAKYRPVDADNDIFGFRSVVLNGTLYDDSNIATQSMLATVQSSLTGLQNAYNAHVYQQGLDVAQLRNDITTLYDLIRLLGVDINALMGDVPLEETIPSVDGQTDYAPIVLSGILTWSPMNNVQDIVVYRNGERLHIDTTGGSNDDYVKLNDHQIRLSFPCQATDYITIRQERSLLSTSPKNYFLVNKNNNTGRAIISPERYSVGTEKLSVWRNGILLVKSNSIGMPIDRYEETTSQFITLGESAIIDDIITLQNRNFSLNYRFYQTGVTGLSISIPSYVTGQLRVYRNGLIMNSAGVGDLVDQYAEDSTTSIALSSAALVDEIFVFEYLTSSPGSMMVSPGNPGFVEIQTGFTGTALNLANAYLIGDDHLMVYRNGRLMYKTVTLGNPIDRYVETTSNSITLGVAASVTDWFTIVYN